MANMSPKKVAMPEQDPLVRNKNFKEVSLGYTPEMAMEEASRCLNCKNKPCVSGCPVNVQIPDFIAKIAEGDFVGAYEKIGENNALPAVCGRVCPQEMQCEGKCVRGIKGESVAIGRLERFVADWHNEHFNGEVKRAEANGHKVAVVGSGPAGITIATSIASALTQNKVRKNIAMTGEITLRGRVLPVGGIKEKILAAKRAGITDVILCYENRKDIEEIPDFYLSGVTFHYVENVKDVWNIALTKDKVDNHIEFEIPEIPAS
mgnify:CR=1 FL=1